MLKYSIALLLALIVALGISFKTLESRSTELALSNQKLEDLRKHEAALAGKYQAQYLILTKTIKARDDRIQSLVSQAKEAGDKLDEALKKNRDWAERDVPLGVRSGLCGYVNCTQ